MAKSWAKDNLNLIEQSALEAKGLGRTHLYFGCPLKIVTHADDRTCYVVGNMRSRGDRAQKQGFLTLIQPINNRCTRERWPMTAFRPF